MINNKLGNEKIIKMRKSMSEDGWKESENLPKEWIYRYTTRNDSRSLQIIAMDGVIFDSFTSVREYMKSFNGFEENDLAKLSLLQEESWAMTRLEKYVWNNEDKTLPEEWKSRKSGTKLIFLSPEKRRWVILYQPGTYNWD